MEPAPAPPVLQPASKGRRLLAHVTDLALSLALARALGVLVGYQPEVGSLSNIAIFLIPPAVVAALAVPVLYLGGTLGQRLCGLSLVDAGTLGAPRTGKVWQWAATKQILWMWDLKSGLLGSSLFYLTILTDKRGRSLYDDWADLYVVQPAPPPEA
ncbi:MAG: hypothetical protein RL250_1190 [Verrucomicrobiota bacterium]|jgi:uncharacterized RDD family membrane protein YckC